MYINGLWSPLDIHAGLLVLVLVDAAAAAAAASLLCLLSKVRMSQIFERIVSTRSLTASTSARDEGLSLASHGFCLFISQQTKHKLFSIVSEFQDSVSNRKCWKY